MHCTKTLHKIPVCSRNDIVEICFIQDSNIARRFFLAKKMQIRSSRVGPQIQNCLCETPRRLHSSRLSCFRFPPVQKLFSSQFGFGSQASASHLLKWRGQRLVWCLFCSTISEILLEIYVYPLKVICDTFSHFGK